MCWPSQSSGASVCPDTAVHRESSLSSVMQQRFKGLFSLAVFLFNMIIVRRAVLWLLVVRLQDNCGDA